MNQKTLKSPQLPWKTAGLIASLSVLMMLIFLRDVRFIYSAILGSFFSAAGFIHLMRTQLMILKGGKRSLVFIRYFSRLFLYAFPVIFAIKLPNYFNLVIILVYLFLFQVSFIVEQLRESLMNVRNQSK